MGASAWWMGDEEHSSLPRSNEFQQDRRANSGALPARTKAAPLVEEDVEPTLDVSRQAWPDQSKQRTQKLSRLDFPGGTELLQLPGTADTLAILEVAHALLLSAYCGTPAIGFASFAPAITGSAIANVVLDVDRSLSVAQFLTARSGEMTRRCHDVVEKRESGDAKQGRHQFLPSTLLALRQSSQEASSTELAAYLPRSEVRFLIDCAVTERSIAVSAHYDPESLTHTAVKRFISQLLHVACSLCSASATDQIRDVPLVPSQETLEIKELAGPAARPIEDVISRRLKDTVRMQPCKMAVEAWDGSLTYQEILDASERLAWRLSQAGVAEGDLVPICFHKSRSYPTALLAVLRLGAAFVPLDPAHPIARLQSITDQLGGRIVLTSDAAKEIWAPVVRTVIALDSPQEEVPNTYKESLPPIHEAPESLAFVLFTSGSTGKPKGVEIQHRAFLSGVFARAEAINRNGDSRVFQFASHGFDVSVEDTLTTFLTCGTVCIPSESERQTDFEAAFSKYKANTADLTPSLINALSRKAMPTLRTLISGGEAISQEAMRAWAPHVNFINTYGPAESSIVSTVTTRRTVHSNPRDVGPTYGCRPWVVDVDDDKKLVPLGAPGELIVEGPVVARGYLNDAHKSSAAFMHSLPWCEGHVQAYKTGDVVKLTEDGRVEFLHRKGNMAKLNGQRLELSDIEVHVRALLNLAAIAVDVFSHGGQSHLALFFQSFKEGGTQSRLRDLTWEEIEKCRQLKADLSKMLPAYMVPSTFFPLTRLPLTTSNKIDRPKVRALAAAITGRELEHYKLTSDVSSERPLNEAESKIRAAWAQMLQVSEDSIHANSDFFGLGADSIRAMRLATFFKRAGVPISIVDIFRHSELCEMATKITKAKKVAVNPATTPPPFSMLRNSTEILKECVEQGICSSQEDISDVYPCAPLQEAVIASSSAQPGAYVLRQTALLPKTTDVARLQAAWNTVVAAHPILRTKIMLSKDEGSLQVVLKDLTIWQTYQSPAEHEEFEKSHPMSYQSPLLRVGLVPDANGKQSNFVMSIHHAIYDAVTFDMIIVQVFRTYDESGYQIPSALPFSAFVRALLAIDKSAARHFWQKQLNGTPTGQMVQADLDLAKPRVERKMHGTAPIESTRVASVTLATQIRAAWALTTSCFCGSSDVVFGATSAGRNIDIEGLADAIGPTVATVPVRIAIDETLTMHKFLLQLQEQATNIIAYEQYGMREISQLNPTACKFQTILAIKSNDDAAYDGMPARFHKSALANLEMVGSDEGFYTHDLVLDVRASATDVLFDATFNESVIPAWRLRSVLDTLQYVLEQVLNCDENFLVGQVDYCSSADVTKIHSWNSSVLQADQRLIHKAIQSQGNIARAHTAVHAWDGVLTYEALDDLSSRLAAHLITMRGDIDARPCDLPTVIPLCFERSCFMVVAVLAVLKAGWAYVALDTSNPDQRLSEMCGQLSSSLTLCGAAQSDRLAKVSMKTLTIDANLLDSLEPKSPTSTPSALTAASPALVVFTSGSTGLPKPTLISHQAVCTAARDFGPRMNFSRSSRVLQNAAYAFGKSCEISTESQANWWKLDIHACEMFFTLLGGGTLFLTNDDQSRLLENIAKWDINWLFMTPSATEIIPGPEAIPSVQTLMMAGEAPNCDHYSKLCNGSLSLINAYGPSENTLFTSMQVVTSKDVDPRQIGVGLNTHTWIVHSDHVTKLLPIGATGELLLEGPQLADGYVNRPLETDQAFISRPKWNIQCKQPGDCYRQGRMLYRTGDLVHYLADGSLRIDGRKGSQVKLRGQRLELEEVEHRMRHFSDSQALAAEVFAAPNQRQLLAAFIQDLTAISDAPQSDILPMTEEFQKSMARIRSALTLQLPSYMIPSLYIPICCLPKTLSGKLDRRTLKSLLLSLSASDIKNFMLNEEPKAPPQSTEELLLQRLWSNILNLPAGDIGLHDSFFALGGDSISAIKLAAAVTSTDKASRLSVKDILAQPQLKNMANCVARESTGRTLSYEPFALLTDSSKNLLRYVAESLGRAEGQIQDIYPCSALQEAMFTLSLQQQGAYVSQHVFRFRLGVDPERLRKAWAELVSRTDVLRTRILRTPSGEPMQVLLHPNSVEDEALVKGSDERDRRPLRIASGSSLHTAFFQHSSVRPGAFEFVWEASHAVFDAWSLKLMMDHLDKLYEGLDAPLTTTQYKHFINHILQCDRGASEAYWRKRLAGGCTPVFPPDPVFPTTEDRKLFTIQQRFRNCSHPRFTFSTILQAAWAFILARKHSRNDVIFGMTVSGRNSSMQGVETVVGPTICTIPRRAQVNPQETVAGLLE